MQHRYRFALHHRHALASKGRWQHATVLSGGDFHLTCMLLSHALKFVFYAPKPGSVVFRGYILPADYFEEF